jgi:LysR family transcriptional regulator (chromosome initiation inhibitor)
MSLLSPQLQAFQTVARTRTVHGAAKELGLTQTGVTQRIRALESSLNITLFARSRRGMLLTSEGEALLRYCLASRDLEGPVLARLQGGGDRALAQVTITGPTSILRARVIPAQIPVLRQFSQLHVRYHITDAGTEMEDLRNGTAQIAIVPPAQVLRELDSKLLRPEKYVLVGPRKWKSRAIAEIVREERMIDFSPQDETSLLYLRKFRLDGLARPDRHFLNNNESLAVLIEAGLGYGVLTLEFAERFLQRCDVTLLNGGKVLEQPMAMAWYPRPSSAPYWKALLAAVK